jgi:phage regulator Rha-like protein
MKKQAIEKSASLVPVEIIQNKIYLIRDHKVMFDRDLAELYEVLTKYLTRQVRRNIERFPDDFMFQLTRQEANSLRCQIGTLKRGQHYKYLPYVFTEQGVAMLSSVLNSKRAIQVNIQIIRVFTNLREMMISHKDLARKIEDLERNFQEKFQEHDKKIILIFNAIKELLADKEEAVKKRGPLGFIPPKLPETSNKSKR